MKCKGCGLEKDPSLFYESNKARCKECVKDSTKKNREDKREYYREYDRNRPNHKERVETSSQRVKKKCEEDVDYKLKVSATKVAWASRNKEKRRAQNAVGNAVKYGKLIKPVECGHCQSSDKAIQGHHWSYLPEHWLDVIWLCTTCHGKEHKRLNEIGRDPDKQGI